MHRGLTATFTAALLGVGCSIIAPFETRDRPDSGAEPDGDVENVDADLAIDGDHDVSDGADGEACVPLCDQDHCGSNGCGAFCPTDTCEDDQVCDEAYQCVHEMVARWVLIRPGIFPMGSAPEEVGRPMGENDNELLHDVTLTHPFIMRSTEVTRSDYVAMIHVDPSYFSRCDICPVEMVSWHDAAAYANALSVSETRDECYECSGTLDGLDCKFDSEIFATPYECAGYRLPTEAEWEYAARAGDERATYIGDLDATVDYNNCSIAHPFNAIAWWQCPIRNDNGESQPVRGLEPNDWGLFDMLGNVWEWCHDWYDLYSRGPTTDPWGPLNPPAEHDVDSRVSRGGGGSHGVHNIRAATRFHGDPTTFTNGWLGFRVVRTVRFEGH